MYERWEKLGLVFDPRSAGLDWMRSHAQNPTPEPLGGGRYRVYFSTRDAQNRSRGSFVVFDLARPSEILAVGDRPLLDLGPLGAFDDAGAMPGSLVDRDGLRYLYYTGWSRTVDVPFAFHIGLVISRDGGATYQRDSLAPVLGRNRHDPFIAGAPFVLFEEGRFRMWYSSCTRWEKETPEAKAKHYYTIKHATSKNGIDWETSDHLCLDYQAQEYALARPVVRRTGGHYEMWFTFRGGAGTYRLGHATSPDGLTWTRAPQPIGIDVSPSGWDSEMICYAHPFEHAGRLYALYNGNAYGATGVGLAVCRD